MALGLLRRQLADDDLAQRDRIARAVDEEDARNRPGLLSCITQYVPAQQGAHHTAHLPLRPHAELVDDRRQGHCVVELEYLRQCDIKSEHAQQRNRQT